MTSSTPTRARVLAIAATALALALAGCSSDDDGAARTTTTVARGGAATTTTSSATASSTTPDEAAPVADIGIHAVGSTTFDLTDPSRDTDANGDAPATEGRALPTTVWYPAVGTGAGSGTTEVIDVEEGAEALDGRFPLVVFSHGVTGRGVDYSGNLVAWASAGYVVIAADYPLSNRDAPGGPTVTDVGNQPADASYLIDVFTDADGPAADVVAHVDTERIGAVGHSLGAITTLGLGFGCCVDDRVDAASAWAGGLFPLQGEPAVDESVTDRPLLIVHGTDDATLPYAKGEEIFAQVADPRWFITLPGAGHIPPYVAALSGPQSAVVTRATLAFLDAELKGDPEGIDRLDAVVADAGPDVATLQTADT